MNFSTAHVLPSALPWATVRTRPLLPSPVPAPPGASPLTACGAVCRRLTARRVSPAPRPSAGERQRRRLSDERLPAPAHAPKMEALLVRGARQRALHVPRLARRGRHGQPAGARIPSAAHGQCKTREGVRAASAGRPAVGQNRTGRVGVGAARVNLTEMNLIQSGPNELLDAVRLLLVVECVFSFIPEFRQSIC